MPERSTSVDINAPGGLTFEQKETNPLKELTDNPVRTGKIWRLYRYESGIKEKEGM